MIGISTTYFASSGYSIYDSVHEAEAMGFKLAELGAAHRFEPNAEKTLKKIKKDFPEMQLTLHGLFPPQRKKFWFNPSEGLTSVNKKVINNFFSSAEIVGAQLVSFHPGFRNRVFWGENKNGMNYPIYGKEIPREKAVKNVFKILALAQSLSEKSSIPFAIENIPEGKSDKPLIVNAADYEKIFSEFPNCGLLLDFGHALFSGNLEALLGLKQKIVQLHLHYSKPSGVDNFDDNHFLVESEELLEPLASIRQLNSIPLIFEHGKNIGRNALLEEKKLLESFLEQKKELFA